MSHNPTAFPMQDPQAIHSYAIAKVEGITDTAERDRAYTQARAEAVGGMTLRDWFAANAPSDEVRELDYNALSRRAQEAITGLKHPDRPANEFDTEAMVAFQIEQLEFKCAVNAAIRFKLADAMLKAREGGAA